MKTTTIAPEPEVRRRLRSTRKALNLTQDQLQKKTGISQGTIHVWEASKLPNGLLEIPRYALFLGMSPNDLLLENDRSRVLRGQGGLERIPDDLRDDMAEVVENLYELHMLCGEGKDSPISIYLEHSARMLKTIQKTVQESTPSYGAAKVAEGRKGYGRSGKKPRRRKK